MPTLINGWGCMDCCREYLRNFIQVQWERMLWSMSNVCHRSWSGEWWPMCHLFALSSSTIPHLTGEGQKPRKGRGLSIACELGVFLFSNKCFTCSVILYRTLFQVPWPHLPLYTRWFAVRGQQCNLKDVSCGVKTHLGLNPSLST